MAETSIPASAAPVRMETMVERQRRRARLVLALRLAVLVFLVGGWEFGVRFGLIDPRLEPADVVSAERRLAHAAGDTCVRIGQPRPEGEQIVLQLDELRA